MSYLCDRLIYFNCLDAWRAIRWIFRQKLKMICYLLVYLNWLLFYFLFIRYTAFSELLPLLAAGTTPLLKVKQICQSINTSSLTIENSTTLSGPFGSFSFSASAAFEVRSPTRIQVLLITSTSDECDVLFRAVTEVPHNKKGTKKSKRNQIVDHSMGINYILVQKHKRSFPNDM